MSACTRLLLGYQVHIRNLVNDLAAEDPTASAASVWLLLRAVGAVRGMSPEGMDWWHIPSAAAAKRARDRYSAPGDGR